MKEWLKNTVFYEIYPQTFNDSNGDGIGDFNGIIEKLDYVKDMGFNGIWLNPCFASPFYDAGYDVEDFYKVAPRYGTNDDLKRLIDECHAREIRILLDLVPGHTSVTCNWLKESMRADENEFTNRYIWTNSTDTKLPEIKNMNGFIAGFSEREGSLGVNYFTTQPALNYGFAEVTETWQFAVDSEAAIATRDELINIMRFWLDMGCDGFRVDMAAYLVKADDKNNSATVKLWQDIFKIVRAEYPDAVFVAEWGTPTESLEGGFDMDFMLYNMKSHAKDLFRSEESYFNNNEIDISEWLNFYLESYEKTKDKGLICFISGNHDVERASSFISVEKMKLMYAFILSMPGAPFIYNGDEIGMKFVKGLKSVEGAYQRTGSRTPMQWDDSLNSGFSDADLDDLYIPMDNSANRPTVKAQLEEEGSLLNEVRRLIEIRKENIVLQAEAEFVPYHITKEYPMVYLRRNQGENIVVAINPSDKTEKCDCDFTLLNCIYNYGGAAKIENGKLVVPPLSASFIKLK